MLTIGRTFLAGLLLAFPVAFTDMLAPELPAASPAPKVHEVRMVQEGNTFKYQPASLTVRPGDRVKFTMVSGGAHNVAFDAEKIPDRAETALSAGMPAQISPLAGTILSKAGESYTVSFADVPPGTYPFYCMPHMSMGMRGTVTVR